jgi:hypothetical protein
VAPGRQTQRLSLISRVATAEVIAEEAERGTFVNPIDQSKTWKESRRANSAHSRPPHPCEAGSDVETMCKEENRPVEVHAVVNPPRISLEGDISEFEMQDASHEAGSPFPDYHRGSPLHPPLTPGATDGDNERNHELTLKTLNCEARSATVSPSCGAGADVLQSLAALAAASSPLSRKPLVPVQSTDASTTGNGAHAPLSHFSSLAELAAAANRDTIRQAASFASPLEVMVAAACADQDL